MVPLDGFFEGPNGELDWHVMDEEFNEYTNDLLSKVDTILFGRSKVETDIGKTIEAYKSRILIKNQSKIYFHEHCTDYQT